MLKEKFRHHHQQHCKLKSTSIAGVHICIDKVFDLKGNRASWIACFIIKDCSNQCVGGMSDNDALLALLGGDDVTFIAITERRSISQSVCYTIICNLMTRCGFTSPAEVTK